ncbi:MAG: ABC transporter ATP-binding protein [Gammaproteobacteria bacterium]
MKGLLKVRNLTKRFRVGGGLLRKSSFLTAVEDVSFDVPAGTTFGLVGESGCGKSTLGRCILGLEPLDSGSVNLDGTELYGLGKAGLFALRRRMQAIFQDPYSSLSPRRTIAQTLLEPLETHSIGDSQSRFERVVQLLEMVGLRESVLHRYPHEFSGGQRQRVGIARALALQPDFVVADEAVSALDVSVQSQVLNLLRGIQEEHGLSFLFISHDLAVVQHISDNVGVMYLGQLVEVGAADAVFWSPRHPYTEALIEAVPIADPNHTTGGNALQGEVPSPLKKPSGCAFHTRCPKAFDRCSVDVPKLEFNDPDNPSHGVRCHLFSA